MALITKKEKVINKVVMIPIDEIHTNPSQPRTKFDTDQLNVLAISIKDNGLLQPITVRRNLKGNYEIISGERRCRACEMLGYKFIDGIIIDKTPMESAVLALIENLHREDLDMFEQANALKVLIANWNVTQEEAASRLAMTQSTIANKLRILKLSDTEQQIILNNHLTERHARALLKVKDESVRLRILNDVVEKKLNVQQTEKYIEEFDIKPRIKYKKPKMTIKHIKVFTSTINKAVKIMKESGIDVSVDTQDTGECIEYIVKIPLQNLIPQNTVK